MHNYQDKRIWINGASSGIGKALVTSLISSGARVVITARRTSLLEEIKKTAPNPEKVTILPADLTEIDQLPEVCQQAWDAFDGLDLVIMNAGVSQRSLFKDIDFETGRALFDINFFSHARIMHEIVPRFEQAGQGQIAAVTSLSGYIPAPLRIYYASAKHALHGFYDTLRTEIWNSGIRVSLIVPGFVRTEISQNALLKGGDKFGRLDPLQKNGISAEKAAKKILGQLKKQKKEIYVGYTPNAAIALFLGKFFPGILMKILRNMTEIREEE